jgi:hypothetical protein
MLEIALMEDTAKTWWTAFSLSVIVGAFAGMSLQSALALWAAGESLNPSELWAVPVIVLIYGAIAIPFVAMGLALFGLPATVLLRRWAGRWWMGTVAILWGGISGKLTYFAIDHLLFFGNYDLRKVELFDMGLLYGVPTGLVWWLMLRRTQDVDSDAPSTDR